MFLLCYREHRGAPDFFHAEKINFYAEKNYQAWILKKERATQLCSTLIF